MKYSILIAFCCLLVGPLSLTTVMAEKQKAIWGTDGAAINTGSTPKQQITPTTVKPTIIKKQTTTEPKKVKPGTLLNGLGDDPWSN